MPRLPFPDPDARPPLGGRVLIPIHTKQAIAGTAACILGAAVCFGMFFGFGPSPDNQMVLFFGVVCLLCAYICWSNR